MLTENWTIKFQGRPVSKQQKYAESKQELETIYNGMSRIFSAFTIERGPSRIVGPRERKFALNIPGVGTFDQVQVFNSDSEFAFFCLDAKKNGMEVR